MNGLEQHNLPRHNRLPQDPQHRWQSVGGVDRPDGPDIAAITGREIAVGRRRRLASITAVLVLVVGGSVTAAELTKVDDPATAVFADRVVEAGSDQVGGLNSAETTIEDRSTIDDGGPTPPDNESDHTGADTQPEAEDDAGGADPALPRPWPASLSDGIGGWLTVTDEGTLSRLAPNGDEFIINLPDRGVRPQRFVNDLVLIGGTPYLLIDEFVSRDDLAFERVREVASRYGLTIDPDSDYHAELAEVVTPRELDSLNHFEVSIMAVDLNSGRVITVERRVINSIADPGWVYNGHVTASGPYLVVMRELWQGTCMYAEALTLDGTPVDDPISEQYPKPVGLEMLTFEEISAMQAGTAPWPEPCLTLDEIDDGGVSELGTQAIRDDLDRFRQAWFEAGLE